MSVFLNPVKRIDTVMKKHSVCPDDREITEGENAVFNSRMARRCYNLKVDAGKSPALSGINLT
jgi:hypothetical protein